MLKEQIFQIVDRANFKQGQTSKEATNTILNLFKAEIEKLTVIDNEEIEQALNTLPATYKNSGLEIDRHLIQAQLRHTKKELLDLMVE